jgi:hypothetical protein
MITFHDFKVAVSAQFAVMEKHQLFVSTTSKETIRSTYLNSFKEGDDPLYITNTEHDCTCCKQFINNIGKVLAIVDGKLVSIWDIQIGGKYQPVVDALSKLVKADGIDSVYYHFEKSVGQNITFQQLENGDVKEWEHFHQILPTKYVVTNKSSESIESLQGKARTACSTLRRGLDEITQDSLEVIVDLISQKSLYRGEEHLKAVKDFLKTLKTYKNIVSEQKTNFVWLTSITLKHLCTFRNSVIGTLATDLSSNVDLEDAVKMFEAKVAPTNYKRPTKLVTKAMITKAQTRAVELNLIDSLPRRYAILSDVTINNVLFADSSAKPQMGAFDKLITKTATKTPKMDKVEEVSIENFVNNILPSAETLEVFVENSHKGNFVSLIAPVNTDSELLFKWSTNFSWSYNGEVADSMKERVTAAGGRVDGVLRFTHSWNHTGKNNSLMDLHVFMPTCSYIHKNEVKNKVYESYPNGQRVGWNNRKDFKSQGEQDVDYTNSAPENYIPIENITFPSINKMPEGDYYLKIHNWNGTRKRNSTGFKAEIEFQNQLFQYDYPKPLKHHEWVDVAKITLKNKNFTIEHLIPTGTEQSQDIWNLSTQNFKKVSTVMMSPNHWDGEQTGNKHYFFMLEDCLNPDDTRGFYNEFLKQELNEDRKVFEMLGSELKAKYSENQLSGLGFSSTQKNHVLVKVTGSFNRTIKIKF